MAPQSQDRSHDMILIVMVHFKDHSRSETYKFEWKSRLAGERDKRRCETPIRPIPNRGERWRSETQVRLLNHRKTIYRTRDMNAGYWLRKLKELEY